MEHSGDEPRMEVDGHGLGRLNGETQFHGPSLVPGDNLQKRSHCFAQLQGFFGQLGGRLINGVHLRKGSSP